MSTYRVKYAVLPPGVGPDDYESGDLEHRERDFELSDPESAGEVAGQDLRYGPGHAEITAAVQEVLERGERPIILRCDLV
ncbi:hypothetical protein ABZX77_40800 [Streptomyces sp. NPDC004237]|uniref:hypothetical protein n=1 Tax=Streptomyces sp. NPDC004237 TaxID=3154455 RepID=UPI0033B18682